MSCLFNVYKIFIILIKHFSHYNIKLHLTFLIHVKKSVKMNFNSEIKNIIIDEENSSDVFMILTKKLPQMFANRAFVV